jgi:hypothetical protein
MFLINIIKDPTDRREKPFSSDLIYWYDDITLNAYAGLNGLIVSPRLKRFLEKFSLGDHKFYEVEIINSERTAEKEKFIYFIQ